MDNQDQSVPSYSSYFNNDVEAQQMTSKCQHLSRYLDSDGWCKKCTMKNVSSGHPGIDKFIRGTQKKSASWSDPYLEWIPYDQFEDVKEIGEGNFSIVYSAIWTQGRRVESLNSSRRSKTQCPRERSTTVALKRIKNSQEMTREYIKQLKIYYRCSLMHSKKRVQQLLEFYGMTKDPNTGEFLLVTQYAEHGNIHTLLDANFSSYQWSEKIWWLCDIVSNLHSIHKAGYVHGNVHPGNILQIGVDQREMTSTLADTGLYIPANNHKKLSNKDIYGVLPYMAPEVILGGSKTKESDIFSIGILMIELASGIQPFSSRSHNSLLALEIIQGLRPKLSKQIIPKVYINLALDCCRSDPTLRPSAKQLLCIFNCWWRILNNEDPSETSETKKAFMNADEALPTLEIERNNDVKNSDTFYTSRLLQFEDVSRRERDSGSEISLSSDDINDSDDSS